MKRADLKTKFAEAGVAEDKINDLVDFVMSENGNDLNTLKSENEQLKSSHEKEVESLKAQYSELSTKVDGYKDYEELKQFKADTIANQEKTKRVEFLKAQGCKHPDLIIDKVDFSKATYDEEKKAYTGLDEALKGLKASYSDLFENKTPQQINPDIKPKPTESDFMAEYRKNNPNLIIK